MVDARRALSGIQVVELATGMAGETAGLMLAQYGADVVKVEALGADSSRRHDGFRLWNEGKRTLELDLRSAAGAARLWQLVGGADALIVALRPDVVEALGLSDPRAASGNAQLICCSISGFEPGSAYGDLPGYEALVAAKLGRGTIFVDQPERPGAVYAAVPVGAYAAAHGAVQGILAALRQRERGGGGGQFRTSLARGMNTYDMWDFLNGQFPDLPRGGHQTDEHGRRIRPGGNQYLVAATRDGHWIHFANFADHLFRRFIQCIGLDRFYTDPEFEGFPQVPLPVQFEARDLILATIRQKTLAEWQAIFDADGSVGYEVVRHPADVAAHSQVAHNGHLVRSSDGGWRLAPPWTVRGGRPESREHPAPARKSRQRGATVDLRVGTLLHGVTVLELGAYWAGPLAGRLLADYGARVIKLEPPTGDPLRGGERGFRNAGCSFGKESISVNLKTPFGRDALTRLLRKVDVLLHNYRPGVPESLGFGAEDALRLNPSLVHVSAFSYGSAGPMAGRPAFDPIPASITGVATRQGGGCLPPGRAETLRLSAQEVAEYSRRIGLTSEGVCDVSGAIMAATAITYGLPSRERTGAGCVIETTMLAAGIFANSEVFDRRTPFDAQLACEGYGPSPLYRLYPVGDGWVFLACGSERTWQALRAAFPTLDGSTDGFEAAWIDAGLSGRIKSAFSGHTAEELERRCRADGVPCVALPESRADLVRQEWVHAAGMLGPVQDRLVGRYLRFVPLIAAAGEQPPTRGIPLLGEHTAAVLAECGFGSEDITAAERDGAVRCWSADGEPEEP